MYACRKANADRPEIEEDLRAFPKQREKWAVAAQRKRDNPEINFEYPQYVCAKYGKLGDFPHVISSLSSRFLTIDVFNKGPFCKSYLMWGTTKTRAILGDM